MLEESNAFTMVLLDLSSLQTNLYTRLRTVISPVDFGVGRLHTIAGDCFTLAAI